MGVQVTAMGGLRGLADVRAPMIMAFIYYWLCAIPIGYIAAFVFGAGAVGIWAGLATGLFIAAITLTIRFWLLIRPGRRFAVVLPTTRDAGSRRSVSLRKELERFALRHGVLLQNVFGIHPRQMTL